MGSARVVAGAAGAVKATCRRLFSGAQAALPPFVRPSMWAWMTEGRHGDAPEGGILVKEQYGDTASLTDWAVMVRDNEGSWDGWWWGDLSAPSTVTTPLPPPLTSGPDCTQAQYPFAAFGEYCINCHALRNSPAVVHVSGAPQRAVGPLLGADGKLPPTFSQFGEAMLNHFPNMHRAMASVGQPTPTFESQEMADLAVFLYSLQYQEPSGSPHIGASIFTRRACAECHGARAEGALDSRHRHDLADGRRPEEEPLVRARPGQEQPAAVRRP